MKKLITLMLSITFLCYSSTFAATTYLVQLGTAGAATWRSAGAGEKNVDLSIVNGGAAVSLNAWLADKSLKAPVFSGDTLIAGDHVWIAKGTYSLTGTLATNKAIKVFGGFAGTELTVANRAKGTNAWDFTNATILDGAQTIPQGILNISVDGLTVQNFKGALVTPTPGYGGGTGAYMAAGYTMQNCIVTGNNYTATGTQGAGGVRLTGGKLLNSHIYNNTSSAGGGGVAFQSTSEINGCLIENNTTTTGTAGGAGLMTSNSGGGSVINCIVKSNTAGGTGAGLGTYYSAVQSAINITNTQFIANVSKGSGGAINVSVSTTPVNITGCTFSSNVSEVALSSTQGGGAIMIGSGAVKIDKCLFTNNYTTLSNGGAIMSNSLTSAIISNSTFTENTGGSSAPTPTAGAAIYCVKATTINNCLIAGNSGSSAVYVYAPTGVFGTFNNVTVASNFDSTGGVGVYLGVAVTPSVFTNCLFYGCGNSPIKYSTGVAPTVTYCGFDVATLPVYATTGCLNTITASSFKDVTLNDYNLVDGSVAKDAGTDLTASGITTDIMGITRPQGAAFDMGAYEFDLSSAINTPLQDMKGFIVTKNAMISRFNGTVQVYSITGKSITKIQVIYNQAVSLSPGAYIVKLTTSNGTYIQKVVL